MGKTKVCTQCKEEKSVSDFGKRSRNKDGLNTMCKICYNRRKRESYKPTKVNFECNVCGLDRQVTKSHYNSNEFSGRCQKCYYKEVARKNKLTKVERANVKCDNCGDEFQRLESHMVGRRNHYCSVGCKDEHNGILISRERNYNWNPNKTDEERIVGRAYSAYTHWRDSVFERDQYTCQMCGDDRGGNLNAHHIYSYDIHKELRLEVNNGVTWCESCHKDFHKRYGYGENDAKQYLEFIEKENEQLSIL